MVAAGLWARAHGTQGAQQVMTKSMGKERIRERDFKSEWKRMSLAIYSQA